MFIKALKRAAGVVAENLDYFTVQLLYWAASETGDRKYYNMAYNHIRGCPYDNAVAEATFKLIKTEFVYGQHFDVLSELRYHFADYVNWFNNHRIHSSLGYLTPYQYKVNTPKKVV